MKAQKATRREVKMSEKIVCKICDFEGINLSAHLKCHKITSLKYKEIYPNAKIITDECSKRLVHGQEISNVKRYGVKYVFQVPSVIKAIKETNLKNGNSGYKGDRDKMKQTMQKRYGVQYFTQLKSTQELGLQGIRDKFGVRSIFQLPEKQGELQAKARIALDKDPTSIEKIVMGIVPSNVEYVGNRGFIVTCKTLDGKLKYRCPDFIVHPIADKKVIEVFGDYWHKNDTEGGVRFEYAAYGYNALILWEHQIKNELGICKQRISEFLNPSTTTRLALAEAR